MKKRKITGHCDTPHIKDVKCDRLRISGNYLPGPVPPRAVVLWYIPLPVQPLYVVSVGVLALCGDCYPDIPELLNSGKLIRDRSGVFYCRGSPWSSVAYYRGFEQSELTLSKKAVASVIPYVRNIQIEPNQAGLIGLSGELHETKGGCSRPNIQSCRGRNRQVRHR